MQKFCFITRRSFVVFVIMIAVLFSLFFDVRRMLSRDCLLQTVLAVTYGC